MLPAIMMKVQVDLTWSLNSDRGTGTGIGMGIGTGWLWQVGEQVSLDRAAN